MKLFFASFFIFYSLFPAAAQRTVTLKENEIPHLPTDTLPTDRADVRIVTFSDGTFRFIPTNPYHFQNSPAYGANWDTINLFAYRDVELRDLPRRITLQLADSLGGAFRAPARGKVLSKYGRRGRKDHNGTDIRVTHGQPVFAAFDGIVRLSRWNSGGFGNLVIVRHPSGLETYYAHLSRRAVAADDWVRAGQVIGYGGRTGRATTDHLHFEVRYADQSFDAERIIDFERGTLRRRVFALLKDYFSIRSRAVEGIEEDPDEIAAVDPPATVAATDTTATAQPASGTQNPPQPGPVYHTIVGGDTLLSLALRHGTTVANICSLNGITRTTILRIGRKLRIK